MQRFLQLHLLTVYPPANLNRDDTGRPKTAIFGGAQRLRVSSQSLKRAWRESDVFAHALLGHLGTRTKRLGDAIERDLLDHGYAPDKALSVAIEIARCFGKLKKDKEEHPATVETLVFTSPAEFDSAKELARAVASGRRFDLKEATRALLRAADAAVDIAMFGRMLTDEKDGNKIIAHRAEFSREAAVQVAHAITTHRADVEDDYFTAVDELNKASDAGAGHVGEAGFGAGVFYIYICVNRDLLARNLDDDEHLAQTGIAALIEAAATVAPRGKQASFASRARAGYLLAESGESAPRTLAAAFLKPVGGEDLLTRSIEELEKTRERFACAYGDDGASAVMNVAEGRGTLAEVIAFATA
jgi:CRISPR system Cascade subunit CasC